MTEQPPYLRIAADLRARIAAGELRTGDRVPSTRELVRRYGVAMATATRALAVLRDEGVVLARSGAGTVVAAPGAPGTPGRAPGEGAQVARIVAAALAIADAEGLDAVTMRAVAARLGAAPMALYRHVRDKEHLVELMLDAAFAEPGLPAGPATDPVDGGWRPAVEHAARLLWQAFRRHPWAAAALSLTRPQPLPAAMRWSEYVLAALAASGMSAVERFDVHLLVFSHVRGTAINLEAEAAAVAATGQTGDQWVDERLPALRALVADGSAPHVAQMLHTPYDLDLDVLFERGLRYLLDGLELASRSPGG